MSRLEYITNEYDASHTGMKEEEHIQTYLNRLKTFEEKERFLEYTKKHPKKDKK